MWNFSYNLRGIYETPTFTEDLESLGAAQTQVKQLLAKVRSTGRTILTEAESKQVMAHYGIPTVETRVARSESEAAACAKKIGFPVVLKLNSETITHKSDVGGVKLNLQDEESVRQAYRAIESGVGEKAGPQHFQGVTVQPMVKVEGYELIVGSSVDAQFGPVILFGSGGQLVEVYRRPGPGAPAAQFHAGDENDGADARFRALKGVRGRAPVDLAIARICSGSLQQARRRSAVDQGNGYQSRFWPPPNKFLRSMRASSCRTRRRPRINSRGLRSGPIRRSMFPRGG